MDPLRSLPPASFPETLRAINTVGRDWWVLGVGLAGGLAGIWTDYFGLEISPLQRALLWTLFLLGVVIASLHLIARLTNKINQLEAGSGEENRRLLHARARLKSIADDGREKIGQKGRDAAWFGQWNRNAERHVRETLITARRVEFAKCWPRAKPGTDANDPEFVDRCFLTCCRWLEVMSQKATVNDLNDLYRYGVD